MAAENEDGFFGSNGDLRLLIDNVLDVVAVVRQDGKLDFVSESVQRVLGWTPAELRGANSLKLFHPEDRARIAALIGTPNTDHEGRLYLARYRHKDGSWHTLEASGKRLVDGRLIIAARDITERLEAETALRRSREQLHTVVNNAPLMIWAIDRHGVFTLLDGLGLRDIGGLPDVRVGTSIMQAFDGVPDMVEAACRALKGEAFSYVSHYQGHTFDARYEPIFDESGVLDGAIGVATDITERWQAERQIHLQAKMLEALGQGAMAIDREMRLIYWNPAARQLLGAPSEDVLGRDVRESFPQESALVEEMNAIAQRVLQGEVWSGETQLRRCDGEIIPAFIEMTPLRNEAGEVIGVVSILQDISARRKAEVELKASEERYALAARGANAGLWDWDLQTNTVFYADRWKTMLGWQPHEIGDSPEEWLGRVHPDEVEDVREAIQRHLEQVAPHFECEYRISHEDGTFRWMVARGIAVHGADGKAMRFAGSQTDVTERKVAEQQLVQNAFFDTLTQLPNRALFIDRLDRMIARMRRRPEVAFALLFLDLDRFKNINDSLGHGVGDDLLVHVARRLEECLRANDTLARLGGDEFAILLEDVADVADATQLAERIQRALSAPLQVSGHDIFVSTSIGIAMSSPVVLPEDAAENAENVIKQYSDPQEMLRDADTAMYQAKAQGKACYEVFNSEMHKHAFDLLKIETDLRRAIERDELETHYQPIVSLETGTLIAFEALVRWRHPERGLVPPDEFIPVAEDSGLILPLGKWVLRDVCRQIREWKDDGEIRNCQPCVAVNISSRQFTPELVEQVRSNLEEFNLSPSCIRLEITESVIMENAATAASVLAALKEIGMDLAIDDFGTGYSSLAALYQFPVDVLKIDRSFVRRLQSDGDNTEIVRSILSLASNMRIRAVAEGIETEEQFQLLRELGCAWAQGFWMARPVVAAQAQSLLDAEPFWWKTPVPV